MTEQEPEKIQNSTASRTTIIGAVTTPLGLFALFALIIEALLGVFAARAEGLDFTILICGMIGAFVLLLVIVAMILIFRPEAIGGATPKSAALIVSTTKIKFDFDVYISAPMAAFDTEEEYAASRIEMMEIVQSIKEHLRMTRVYYAGESIKSKKEFDAEVLAIDEDLKLIRESKYFFLYYPAKLASSVLVELGYALALQKPTVIFVRRYDDLPYLLKDASEAFRYVRTYICPDHSSIIQLMKKNGPKTLPAG